LPHETDALEEIETLEPVAEAGDLDEASRAGDGNPGTVGADRQSGNAVRGTPTDVTHPPCRYIPRSKGRIVPAAEEVVALVAERQGPDPVGVAHQGVLQLAADRVPDLHRPVLAAAGQPPAVGPENNAGDPPAVSLTFQDLL